MKLVKKLKKALERENLPKEVVALYLYGSSLTGKLRKDSDVDVGVLLFPKLSPDRKLEVLSEVKYVLEKILKKMEEPREVSVCEMRSDMSVFLLKNIILGERIYEREEKESLLLRYNFESFVLSSYEDFSKMLEKKVEGLHEKK